MCHVSDISRNLLNQILSKVWNKKCCKCIFQNDIPTCGAWPGCRPPTYLEPFSIVFSWKIVYEACAMCVLKIWLGTWPGWCCQCQWAWFEGLYTILNQFVLKNWIWNIYHICFWKYDIPTCGTWPGCNCRRQWTWLGGFWHIWHHS